MPEWSSLPEPQPGEPIRAELIAEMARRLSGDTSLSVGYQDAINTAQDIPALHSSGVLFAKANENVAAWSIFGLASDQIWSDPMDITIKKASFTQGGHVGVLYTNGPIDIKSGGKAIVWPVEQLPMFRVRNSGTIAVGAPCGIDPSQDIFNITPQGTGFVCIGKSSESTVVVSPTSRFNNMLAEVVATYTINGGGPAPVSSTPTLGVNTGQARVKIKVRDASTGTLADAKNPLTGTAPWTLSHVWGLSPTIMLAGELVWLRDITGVGLVATGFDPSVLLPFTLTAEMTNLKRAACTFDDPTPAIGGWGFPNPMDKPTEVHDPAGAWLGAPSGAIGLAYWNGSKGLNSKYNIVWVQMPAKRARFAMLNASSHATAPGATSGGPLGYRQEGPFMLNPVNYGTLQNPYNHAWGAASAVEALYDFKEKVWTIIDVPKVAVSLIGSMSLDATGLKAGSFTANVELAGSGTPTLSWSTLVPVSSDCPNATP